MHVPNHAMVIWTNCARMRSLEQSRESIVSRTNKCVSRSHVRTSMPVFIYFEAQAHVSITDGGRVRVSKLHESIVCQKISAPAHIFQMFETIGVCMRARVCVFLNPRTSKSDGLCARPRTFPNCAKAL